MKRKFSILVPLDGSKESMKAAKYAVRMAKLSNSHITFLHVIAEPPYMLRDVSQHRFYEQARRRAENWLGEAASYVTKEGMEANSHVSTGPKSAANGIVDYAKEHHIDLIVISRGGYGSSGFLIGSVSNAMINRSHCPVLLVK